MELARSDILGDLCEGSPLASLEQSDLRRAARTTGPSEERRHVADLAEALARLDPTAADKRQALQALLERLAVRDRTARL